jgi:hypothetical protein
MDGARNKHRIDMPAKGVMNTADTKLGCHHQRRQPADIVVRFGLEHHPIADAGYRQ